MKTESSVQILLPTVQYGNLTLFTKVGLDTESDLGRVNTEQERLGIEGEKGSLAVVAEVTRRLAIEEIAKMKKDVDKLLGAQTYKLESVK